MAKVIFKGWVPEDDPMLGKAPVFSNPAYPRSSQSSPTGQGETDVRKHEEPHEDESAMRVSTIADLNHLATQQSEREESANSQAPPES